MTKIKEIKIINKSVDKETKKRKIDLVFNSISKPVESVIKNILSTYLNKKSQKIIKYQISTGGKRMRPSLAMISCWLLGGKTSDVIFSAAGLEILHNYSLIVDDIIDKSLHRRGKKTFWFEYGNSIAECVGVEYAAAIFQAAIRSKKPVETSELFAKTMKVIAEGNILDVLFEQAGREDEQFVTDNRYLKISDKDYFEMAKKKTAFLFQTCCEIGGISSGTKNKKEIEAIKDYGFNLGVAFQIQDDILDIFGEKKSHTDSLEEVGKDIKERKGGNIVICFALKELSEDEGKRFMEIIRKDKIEEADVEEAMALIRKTNSFEKAYQAGKKFVDRARKSLSLLPKNKWNDLLMDIADFAIEREH
jgi:geranylgeranyl diphosphate synthase type I